MMGINRMTKKTWIVCALFLLVPGIVGLCIQFAQKTAVHNRIEQASQRADNNSAVEEYLQMYEQWTGLPADQKANNPWGHGSYGGIEIRNRLQDGQDDRLAADLPALERNMSHYPEELADVIYGSDWQQKVADYKKERAVIDAVLIGSIFFLAGGTLVLAGGLGRVLILLAKEKLSKKEQVSEAEAETAESVETAEAVESVDAVTETAEASAEVTLPKELVETPDTLSIENTETSEKEIDLSTGKERKSQGYFQSRKKSGSQADASSDSSKSTTFPMKPANSGTSSFEKIKKDSYFGWAIGDSDSEDLETLMTTEPLTKELTELTEEVSAIRQFAAQQQDQMRKLQDGYDWMIIRRFCLRIIRCIDNIEDRITLLGEQGLEAAAYLEDIRDELVFALESSGVEQFKPDLQITFKGLEKYAEAVRERVMTEDTNLSGCIARVARPGYQYLLNDEDVKIVRCAQVMLYETKEN